MKKYSKEKKKQEHDINKTQRMDMKELKNKVSESKKIKSLFRSNDKAEKSSSKLVKMANNSPKGVRLLKNKTGNIIDVNGLSKSYIRGQKSYTILKNVDLEIKKGEFVTILGPSGSGKTTLLNTLSGLDRSTTGDIIINGTNISALKNSELTTFRRNNIGFVFQSYNLLLELNAYDNAKLGQQLQIDNNKRIDLDELFDKVGLADFKNNSINELSGGQLQRVSIVRALSKNPLLIFADEPTGALDSVTSEKVLKLFKEINKKYGTTIVFVTHDESVRELADKIINVKDGMVDVQKT